MLKHFIHLKHHTFFFQVCGSPEIPLYLLKSVATYKGVDATAPLVVWFWEVMEELSDNERSLFLRFVWGRTRLPRSIADFRGRDFVLQVCSFYRAKFDHLFFLFNPKSKHFYTLMKRIWKQNFRKAKFVLMYLCWSKVRICFYSLLRKKKRKRSRSSLCVSKEFIHFFNL